MNYNNGTAFWNNKTTTVTVESPPSDGGTLDLAAFSNTTALDANQTDPDSLAGKIRIEKGFASNASATLLRNSSTEYSVNLTAADDAENVTFYIQARAIASSQDIENFRMFLDGEAQPFVVDESAGPGMSPWVGFNVPEFSTRTVTFSIENGTLTLAGGAVTPSIVNESTTVSHTASAVFENVSKDGNTDRFYVTFPDAVAGGNLSANFANVSNATDGSDVSISSSISEVDGPDNDSVMDTLTFAVSPDGSGTVDVIANVSVDVTWPAVDSNTTYTIQVGAEDSATGTVPLTDAVNVTVVDTTPPPAFEVSGLEAPTEALEGETITVNATVSNVGGSEGTADVEYVFDGFVEDTQTVTIGAGNSTNVSFTFSTDVFPRTYEHGVRAGEGSAFASITVLRPANLQVSSLEAPSSAVVGDNITVNATIENFGDVAGNTTVEFVFNGSVLRTRNVSVGAGNATDVSFDVSTDGLDPGSYLHRVRTGDDTSGIEASISLTPPLNVIGTDTSAFPTIRTFVNINTPAGKSGNLTADDFSLREDGVIQNVTRVNFTGSNVSSDQKVDIVFVFDDTGSMGEEIDGMQRAVKNFTDRVDANRDARFALVSFKDDVETDIGYTSNATKLKNAVDALRADGGDDAPEDNLDALNQGMELPTRPNAQKVLIDITDERAHYRGDGSGFSNWTMPEIERKIESQGYTYIAVSPDDFTTPPIGATQPDSEDKRVLAENTNGLWIDIGEASRDPGKFSDIIDEIGSRLSTVWVVEYRTADLVRGSSARTISIAVDDPDRGSIEGTGAFIPPQVSATDVDTSGFPTINATLDVNTTAGKNGTLTLDNFNLSEDGAEQTIEDLRFDSTNGTWTLQYTTPDPARNGTARQIAITVTLESGSTVVVTREYTAPGKAANERPLPNFTVSPAQPSVGETVTFNALNSTDPDGTIVEYKWDLDGDGVYDDANGSIVTTSFDSAGQPTIGLMVVDDGGATNTTLKTINVTREGETISPGQPGLGIGVAVVALILVVVFARRRV